ncbi:glycosyltransferase family 2 protein [uncultured Methanospirillum sp.]|uniref:glycosyltransferase family 2 protein n=1 Tax=uncultured Methanospirillum sp. TaxID=262503 RepID=UPI0029C60198|nr:glycosyltransferase family 2 protein [uncultured Methanospirillum sp.]
MKDDPLKICIVANDFPDVGVHGETGFILSFLAKTLINCQFRVKIVYSNSRIDSNNIHDIQYTIFKKHGINIDILDISQYWNWIPEYFRSPKAVYEYFMTSSEKFDVILFPNSGFDGYYCLKCKKSMPCFNKSLLGIICTSSTQWINEHQQEPIGYNNAIKLDFERACMGLAEFVISPYQYLIDWMEERNWIIPEIKIVHPPILRSDNEWNYNLNQTTSIKYIDEIVFAGDIYNQSDFSVVITGLKLFPKSQLTNTSITFLGNFSHEQINKINEIICLELSELTQFRIIDTKKPAEAIGCLTDNSQFVVINQTTDIFPHMINACLEKDIAFICTNSGGLQELFDPMDHFKTLFHPRPQSLVNQFQFVMQQENLSTPLLSEQVLTSFDNICTIITNLVNQIREKPSIDGKITNSLVSVIIPTYNRPKLLVQAVESALAQTYQNVEIIIVDDGSTDPDLPPLLEKLQQKNKIHIIRKENAYLGAARNTGIQAANGVFVVFLDDDNILFPDFVEICLQILNKEGSDCVLPAMRRFSHSDPSIFFWSSAGGGCPGQFMASSLLENHYGDAGMLIKKSVCLDFPFLEYYKRGWTDWALLIDLHLSNVKISYYPRPLYHYLVSTNSMIHSNPTYKNFQILSHILHKHGKTDVSLLGELFRFCETPEKEHVRLKFIHEYEQLTLQNEQLTLQNEQLTHQNEQLVDLNKTLSFKMRGYDIPLFSLFLRLQLFLVKKIADKGGKKF